MNYKYRFIPIKTRGGLHAIHQTVKTLLKRMFILDRQGGGLLSCRHSYQLETVFGKF